MCLSDTADRRAPKYFIQCLPRLNPQPKARLTCIAPVLNLPLKVFAGCMGITEVESKAFAVHAVQNEGKRRGNGVTAW